MVQKYRRINYMNWRWVKFFYQSIVCFKSAATTSERVQVLEVGWLSTFQNKFSFDFKKYQFSNSIFSF